MRKASDLEITNETWTIKIPTQIFRKNVKDI